MAQDRPCRSRMVLQNAGGGESRLHEDFVLGEGDRAVAPYRSVSSGSSWGQVVSVRLTSGKRRALIFVVI